MFHRYEKIADSLQKLDLEPAALRRLQKMDWVVTEKIHGANLALIADARAVQVAKRTELLGWDADFFGFQLACEPLVEPMRALFGRLQQHHQAIRCTVYGELYGGSYPHPEVAALAGLEAIQTGVYYRPDIGFCGFDLAVETLDDAGERQRFYLDFNEMCAHLDACGIPRVEALRIAPLHEASDFDTRIESPLPARLGLPPMPKDRFNLVEGIVLKPLQSADFEREYGMRPVLKIKNAEFREERFHEAQKWAFAYQRDPDLADLIQAALAYCTAQRLESAQSKLGRLRPDSSAAFAEQLRDYLVQDSLEAFESDFGELCAGLSSTERNQLVAALVVAAGGMGV